LSAHSRADDDIDWLGPQLQLAFKAGEGGLIEAIIFSFHFVREAGISDGGSGVLYFESACRRLE
jgi:hypothetical protein